jgi:quercetin dioxygenase-like cupin family protein
VDEIPLSAKAQEFASLTEQVASRLPGLTVYSTGDGETLGEGILRLLADPEKVCVVDGDEVRGLWPGAAAQVLRCFAQGQTFSAHVHFASDGTACRETVVCIGGVMDMRVAGRPVRRLCPGDAIHMEPGEQHSAYAVTDCACIGVTVPACDGYPLAEEAHGPDSIEPGRVDAMGDGRGGTTPGA